MYSKSLKYTHFKAFLPTVKIIIKPITLSPQRQIIHIHISVVPTKNALIIPLCEPVPFFVHPCNFLQSKKVIDFIIEQAEFPQIALGKNVPHAAEFTILLSLLLFNSLTIPALAVAACSGKYHCHELQTLVLCQAKYHSKVFCAPQALASKGAGNAHVSQIHWHLWTIC